MHFEGLTPFLPAWGFLAGHRNLETLLGPPLLPPGRGLPGSSADPEAGELAQPRGKGADCGWAPGEAPLPQNLLEDSPEASLKLLAKLGGLGFPSSAWLRLGRPAGPGAKRERQNGEEKKEGKRKCGFY